MADTSLYEKKIGLLIWTVSKFWQNKLRFILNKYTISLNEYLILESLSILNKNSILPSQTRISSFSGIDESVVCVCLKNLENKNFIKRSVDKDNRKKVINISSSGKKLFNEIFSSQKTRIYNALRNSQSESVSNFKNVLKKIIND